MLRILAVLVAVLLNPKVASACECVGVEGPFLRPGDKGIVATGRVVNISFGNSTRPPSADVEIGEAFRNAEPGARITVYTSSGNCAYPFRVGEAYLLVTEYVEAPDSFWGNIPPGSQAASDCGRTKPLGSAEGKKQLATIRLEMRRLRR